MGSFVYVLVSKRTAEQLSLITDFGIVAAFETRSVTIRPYYDTELAHAKEAIDILGFGLRALREDYGNDFEAWKSRAKVRVLLVDPDPPDGRPSYANQRDLEENRSPGEIANDSREFMERTKNLVTADDGPFQVRLYTCLPSFNIFRIDGTLFWGPYLVGMPSRNMPTFVVKEGRVLFKALSRHFERIWTDFSRPI